MSYSDSNRAVPHPSAADLSARDVHERLMIALTELQRAERNAVLWFAEILGRQLYRQLGYASIHQYATEALGFSKGKTSQFIRLGESLRSLPKLKRAVASGEVGWTKAREVATVATRADEGRWVAVARTSSRRDLERRIAESKAAGRAARGGDTKQVSLIGSVGGVVRPRGNDPLVAPVTVSLRFSPEQFARFDALVEAARKGGMKGSREELLLAALEGERVRTDGVTKSTAAEAGSPVRRSPYQVVVYQCETCQKAHVPTSRGDRPLDLATLRAIVCDSEIVGKGKRLRASVSPEGIEGVSLLI